MKGDFEVRYTDTARDDHLRLFDFRAPPPLAGGGYVAPYAACMFLDFGPIAEGSLEGVK